MRGIMLLQGMLSTDAATAERVICVGFDGPVHLVADISTEEQSEDGSTKTNRWFL
jgi:hypothetical protein